jgi:hypothetical protein
MVFRGVLMITYNEEEAIKELEGLSKNAKSYIQHLLRDKLQTCRSSIELEKCLGEYTYIENYEADLKKIGL